MQRRTSAPKNPGDSEREHRGLNPGKPKLPVDLDAAQLSASDALEQCPEGYERANELLREALQLMEAER